MSDIDDSDEGVAGVWLGSLSDSFPAMSETKLGRVQCAGAGRRRALHFVMRLADTSGSRIAVGHDPPLTSASVGGHFSPPACLKACLKAWGYPRVSKNLP